jgi:NAD(P)-dependent dehydrogenase (short-subunit alcohol dehydrogenase family)
MSGEETRVALVTGASSGIGQACARALVRKGYRVFGASRRFAATAQSANFASIPMNVSSRESVEAAVATIRSTAGRVDLLVNNAGYSLIGSVEDTSDEEARAQIETNLLGPWRLCRAVLPMMRDQHRGCIINIGSMGGRIGLPFQAAYSASKFGLAGFTEALSAELRPWPIRVVLIELGDYRTGITAHRKVALGATGQSAYKAMFEVASRRIAEAEENGRLPGEVANLVVKVAEADSPRLSYQAGPITERVALIAKAILPSRAFERLLVRQYS